MTDDDLPPPKKPKVPKKPPRASWEPPDPDEEAPIIAPDAPTQPTERIPLIEVDPPAPAPVVPEAPVAPPPPPASDAPAPTPAAPTSDVAPASDPTVSGAYAATTTSGAHASPTESGAYVAPTASGAYAAPTTASPTESGAYAAPTAYLAPYAGDATTSGAYGAPTDPSAAYGAQPPYAYTPPESPPKTDVDDPLAPVSSADEALRLAAGVKPLRKRRPPTEPPDDDELDDQPRSRKLIVVALFALVLGLGIAAFVVFGMLNNNKYAIVCESDQIVAVQGRSFPPWGTRNIDDDAMWKPIKIPPEAECVERDTEDYDTLSAWYLASLKAQAEALLKTRDVAKTDEAAALLDQALLHARSTARGTDRATVQQLLGDVQYWRASAKLQQASTALSDAAKQFDAAQAQKPLHIKEREAEKWAIHVRKIIEELQAGPEGLPSATFPPVPPTQPPSERPPAPPGVALPIEPGDAGVVEPPPADAAVLPTGGVLL